MSSTRPPSLFTLNRPSACPFASTVPTDTADGIECSQRWQADMAPPHAFVLRCALGTSRMPGRRWHWGHGRPSPMGALLSVGATIHARIATAGRAVALCDFLPGGGLTRVPVDPGFLRVRQAPSCVGGLRCAARRQIGTITADGGAHCAVEPEVDHRRVQRRVHGQQPTLSDTVAVLQRIALREGVPA